MRHPRGTIWTERALMVLFLASLAGTLNLVMAVHRRAADARKLEETVSSSVVQADPAATNVPANDPSPPRVSTIIPVKPPDPPKPAPQPPEDPTKKALAQLAAATAQELDAAQQADRRTESLEKARRSAIAESERWRRREMLVKQQVSALADRARKIDQQIDTLAAERDALARERDALKAAVATNQQAKGSYAVLPYKGPNGSWRRPIVLECSNGTVTLRPKGPTFSMLDLSSMLNPRSSPVILAVARELLRIQTSESPDGAPVVPYFVFLIRPDGIRSYYEIRARLEPLGIAFGYELIDQNLKVDVPDFDNLATWDGTIPLEEPLMPAPGGRNHGADDGLAWPSPGAGSKEHAGGAGNEIANRSGNKPGVGDMGGEGHSPEDFVWPSQRGTRIADRSEPSPNSGTSLQGSPRLAEGSEGNPGTGRGTSNGPGLGQGTADGPGLAQGPGGSPGLAQRSGGSLGPAQGSGGSPVLAQGSGGSIGLAQGAGGSTGMGEAGSGSLGLAEGSGGRPGQRQGTGGSPGLAQGADGSPGLAQGPRPGSFSGGTRPGDGQGGPGSESGSDPALKPWPFPNQGVELGSAAASGGSGAAGGTTGAGSPPGGHGSGTTPASAGSDKGVALLPDLEPAGSGSAGDPGALAGLLASAASGGAGSNGLPMLNGPEGAGAMTGGGQPITTGTGTDVTGPGGANSQQSAASGSVPPQGSVTTPQSPGSTPNTNTNTNSSKMAQMVSAASANRSGQAADPQAGAGLNSTFGAQGSNSSSSSTNGSAGAAGSSTASTSTSSGTMGSNLASMAGSAPSTISSASGLMFGSDASPSSNQAKGTPDGPSFKSRIPDGPSKTIEVPFEIVVVCRPDGAVIHPGGYLLTSKSLEGGKKENIVVRELLAVAQRRAESDPTIRPQPRVKFLVENGGSESFWAARRQILFSGLGWPMSLQVAGGQDPHVLGKETW